MASELSEICCGKVDIDLPPGSLDGKKREDGTR
jgi:hypothetical protein